MIYEDAPEEEMTKKCRHCQKEIHLRATRCPHCQGDLRSSLNRHPLLWLILIGLIASMILGRFSSNSTPPETTPINESAEQQNVISQDIIFNIPGLIIKTGKHIEKIMGTPDTKFNVTKEQISLGADPFSTISYQKDGFEIFIDYISPVVAEITSDPDIVKYSGFVVEIFLSKSGGSNSESELLRAGNLSEDDPSYTIKFQPCIKQNLCKYSGVHIKTYPPQ